MSKRAILVLWLILALGAGISSSCGLTPEPTEAPSIQPTSPAEAPAEAVHLRLAVPLMGMSGMGLTAEEWEAVGVTGMGTPGVDGKLVQSLEGAADRVSQEYGQEITVEVLGYPLLLQAAGPVCLSPFLDRFLGYDAVLLDSNSWLSTLAEQSFAPVPEGVFQDYLSTVSPEVGSAYTDASASPVGVVQATNPVMTIYNPEMMAVHGSVQAIGLADLAQVTESVPLALPRYPFVAMLMLQSAMPELTFERLLQPALYDNMPLDLLAILGGFLGAGRLAQNLWVGNMAENASQFSDRTIGWTLDDTRFLLALKEIGYKGPVAVSAIPAGRAQGAGAMGLAWLVPADSSSQELAWALVAHVVSEPGMSEWALENGLLPASQSAFQQCLDSEFAQALFPAGLVDADPGLNELYGIAQYSPVWLLPAGLTAGEYQLVYEEANALFVDVVDGGRGLDDAMDEWKDVLSTLTINQ
jgi:hypothetical protein